MLNGVEKEQSEGLIARKAWLETEKRYAGVHRRLGKELEVLGEEAPEELRDAMHAALWHLGVAIVQVARLQQ